MISISGMLHFVANLTEDDSGSGSGDSRDDNSENGSGEYVTSADASSGDIEDSSKTIGNQEFLFSMNFE